MNSLKLNVITHLHSKASNGPASALDETVKLILSDVFGEVPPDLIWRECFTDVDDLREIISGVRTKKKIDILFLTDHMSSRHNRLAEQFVQFAAEDRRIGIGCEVQTVRFSRKHDKFLISPEVLLYGDGQDRFIGSQPYTGVDNSLLEELYEECTLPGSTEPEIFKVREFCQQRNIGCCLAHPFDCQQLDLDETLEVIRAFTYVETVNGGFPLRSSQALCEYVNFHNSVLHNNLAEKLAPLCSEKQLKCLEAVRNGQTLIGLGGSDAHLKDFDRVITTFNTVEEKKYAQDFVRMMIETSPKQIVQHRILTPVGQGISMTGLYSDVLGIVWKNIRTYSHHFSHPLLWPRLIKALFTRGFHELKIRIVRNKSIGVEYASQLNLTPLCSAVRQMCSESKADKQISDELSHRI